MGHEVHWPKGNVVSSLIELEQKVSKRSQVRPIVEQLVEQLKDAKYDELRRAFWSYIFRVLNLEKTKPAIPENHTKISEVHMLAKKMEAYDKQLMQQGMQQSGYEILIDILKDRFEHIPKPLDEYLKPISSEELKRLCKRALHIQSIDELLI